MLIFPMLAIAQVAASREAVSCALPKVALTRDIGNLILSLPTVPVPMTTQALTLSPWGDSIHQSPGDLHRVFLQNLDGLRNNIDEMEQYVSSMAQFQTSTFCCRIMV